MGQCVADAGGFPSNPGIGRTDVVRRKRAPLGDSSESEGVAMIDDFWVRFFLFLKPDDVCIVLRYFWMFFPKLVLGTSLVSFFWPWRTFIHHLWISLVISQAQHPWSLLLARRFALLPQQTEDELAISEACQNLLTLHDIISPRSWWLQVHSKLDRALKFLQRDVGLGDLVQEHDHSSRVMHLFMSGSQKFWNLVMDMFGVWAFDYREMELSFEWSEFLSFVGPPYILALALSGPNSDQFFLFRSLWIILGFLYWMESLIARAPYCASWILMVHPAVLSHTGCFFLPHHFRMESVIHNIDHKTQIRWFKWDIYFQFQSISKPSEAATWCGKSPHHSNSCGSGIHFWMMPSQNLEVAWGRVSTHIWRKRWNKSIGKSMEVLMKHFLYWIIIRTQYTFQPPTLQPFSIIFHLIAIHCRHSRLAHDLDVVQALGALPAPRGHRSCRAPKVHPEELRGCFSMFVVGWMLYHTICLKDLQISVWNFNFKSCHAFKYLSCCHACAPEKLWYPDMASARSDILKMPMRRMTSFLANQTLGSDPSCIGIGWIPPCWASRMDFLIVFWRLHRQLFR